MSLQDPKSRAKRLAVLVRSRRGLAIAGVASVVIAGSLIAVTDPFAASAPTGGGVSDNSYPTQLATVKREPISSESEQTATLGYAGSYSLAIPAGTATSQLSADRSAAQSDEAKVSSDELALKDASAVAGPTNASTLLDAEATVHNDTTALAQARAQLADDERLSCPASSSATVNAAGNTTPGSATSQGASGSSPASAGSGNGSSTTTTSPGSPHSGANSPSATTTTPSSNPSSSTPGASASAASQSGAAASGPTTTAASSARTVALRAELTSLTYSAPSVTTGSGTATGGSTATVTGTVNPNGADTSYAFEYGTTAALGSTSASADAGAGTSPVAVSVDLTGLRPDTTYDFALVAANAAGTVVGTLGTFQTAASSCAAERLVVTEDEQALREAEDALAVDRVDGGTSVTQAEAALSSDEAALTAAQSALSSDEARTTNPGATFTKLPAVGAVIHRGQAAYSLDGRPVPLFYGSSTPYRALYLGVSPGPDVLELEQNLAALGYLHVTPSAQFGPATQAAVEAWQRSLGAAANGVVALGDVVYEPGPIQVDTVTPTAGSTATPGGAVLTATSIVPEVTIDLDASQQSEVKVGDPVSIVLPDNSTTPGVVASVGAVATSSSSSSSSSSQNNGGSSTPTVTVEVTPTKPAQLGGLEQGTVNVWITNESIPEAYVVPVDALLALASGGYALEVVTNGVHHLVAVSLGIFDDANGNVQVSGSGVAAGERVVVPGL